MKWLLVLELTKVNKTIRNEQLIYLVYKKYFSGTLLKNVLLKRKKKGFKFSTVLFSCNHSCPSTKKSKLKQIKVEFLNFTIIFEIEEFKAWEFYRLLMKGGKNYIYCFSKICIFLLEL